MSQTSDPDGDDDVVAAMDRLNDVLAVFAHRLHTIEECMADTRERRRSGTSYGEISRQSPLLTNLVSGAVEDLRFAAADLRRCHARALSAEGLSMAEISRLFGVSRQRVAQLLSGGPEPPGVGGSEPG
jgi:hypothetical protein